MVHSPHIKIRCLPRTRSPIPEGISVQQCFQHILARSNTATKFLFIDARFPRHPGRTKVTLRGHRVHPLKFLPINARFPRHPGLTKVTGPRHRLHPMYHPKTILLILSPRILERPPRSLVVEPSRLIVAERGSVRYVKMFTLKLDVFDIMGTEHRPPQARTEIRKAHHSSA